MYKQCSTCGTEKLTTEFRRDKTQKSGYQTRCKVCARAAIKNTYATNGEATRARNRSREQEMRQRVQEYKQSRSCLFCPERTPICLDFHHLDPTQKDFSLAHTALRSWDTIEAEIEKCVLVCKNCHTKIHAGLLTTNAA